jgi:hypothetical protein
MRQSKIPMIIRTALRVGSEVYEAQHDDLVVPSVESLTPGVLKWRSLNHRVKLDERN